MGFSLKKKRLAAISLPELVRHVSAICPPCASKACLRLVSPFTTPKLKLVRHVSFALAVPPNFARHVSTVSALRPHALSALYLSALLGPRRAPKRCVSRVPFVCLPCVRSLSFLWLWLGLCQLGVRSLVFAPLSVLCPLLSALVERSLCPLFVWSP